MKKTFCYTKEKTKSGSSQVDVVIQISVMENQEKNLRKESVHIAIPKDVGLSKLKNIYVSFFCRGNMELYFVKVL